MKTTTAVDGYSDPVVIATSGSFWILSAARQATRRATRSKPGRSPSREIPVTLRRQLTAVFLIASLSACSFLQGAPTNQREVCRGVQRESGGCDPNQPAFVGETCTEVGREYGKQLDDRMVEVINGPAISQGKARSSRALDVTVLVTARANEYLRNSGMVAACDADEFLSAAEPVFSMTLKENAGALLSEFEEHDYEDWFADLREAVLVIDTEEDQPFDGTREELNA
jgi:hypothetical protein